MLCMVIVSQFTLKLVGIANVAIFHMVTTEGVLTFKNKFLSFYIKEKLIVKILTF